jgi:succinoglycan biosynthesis protein ExoH
MNLDNSVSQRIAIARYVMISGIVILHVPPYEGMAEIDGSLFSYIKAFFSLALFRFTVPVLTAISGYLLFRNFSISKYPKILSKKFTSIFIPLILWNFPLLILLYLTQKYVWVEYPFSFEAFPFNVLNWLNGLMGLIDLPVNYPLNFLRDLFVLILISPFFYVLIKYFQWVGLVFVAFIFLNDLDGYLILRETMPFNFCTGAMAALLRWNVNKLDRFAWLFFTLLTLVCMGIIYFQMSNRTYFVLVAPLIIWPALSILDKTQIGNFFVRQSPNSFFIFLSHGPILLLTWLLYKKVLINYISYEIYWLSAPISVIFFSTLIFKFCNRFFSTITLILVGGR